jgi:two-component system response regulator DesR
LIAHLKDRAALAERPDLAVLDIDLPGLDGITAATQLHERLPACRVVILTVLRRFAAGAGLPAIAAEQFLSYGTVRDYMASAVTKLGGRNRMDAVRIATEAGWL